MKIRYLTSILIIVTISFANHLEYGGYWKNFFTYNHYPDFYNVTDDVGSYNQTGRINLSIIPADRLSFNLSYNLSFRIRDNNLNTLEDLYPTKNNGYRVIDLDDDLFRSDDPASNFSIAQNFDRLYIRYSSFADLYIGRQAIAWGAARMINPTDIIAPYNFDALDTEERIGVDGVRIKIPVGLMHEIDCGYIAGKDFDPDSSAIFIRPKFYLYEKDFSFTFLKFNKNDYLYGFDLMGSILDAGLWFEIAYSTIEISSDNNEKTVRMSIGSDYTMLDGELYLAAEYHFSDVGENDAAKYIDNYSKPSFVKGLVPFMGKNYFIPSVSYQFTPLISGSANIFWNLGDLSAVISPALEYNVAQDLYLSAGGYLGLGKQGTITDAKSEFGNYPDMFFTTFRYYF